MITYEEFETLAKKVEHYIMIKRHVEEPASFWRTFSFGEGPIIKVTWFKNSVNVSSDKLFQCHIVGEIKVRVDGCWPNSARTNMHLGSGDVDLVIPIQQN